MKLKEIHLKKFKRFTDLTITAIPSSARLVVLVGPNGCGKSSVFDAFKVWQLWKGYTGLPTDQSYCNKTPVGQDGYENSNKLVDLSFYDYDGEDTNKNHSIFYFRTAYRNDPSLAIKGISAVEAPTAIANKNMMIENDQEVAKNYHRLISKTLECVYDTSYNEKSVATLRDELIGKIRESLTRLFGDLTLSGVGNPTENGDFLFDKGVSKNYSYKNLSGGEKAAFDLILDLVIKQKYYPDTIFCIDEPEAHMHTALQEKLLGELYTLIGANGQLWIATHSLGMLNKAKELEAECPGSVAFLNFDGFDFDDVVQIMPSPVSHNLWNRILSLTLENYSTLLAPETVVFCEGTTRGRKRKDFDAKCYANIFSTTHPSTVFYSLGGCNDIEEDKLKVIGLTQAIVPNTNVIRIIDRDDRSENEVEELSEKGIKVLDRRHLESYLLDDEIIKKWCATVGKAELENSALTIKQQAINASISRGNATDDIKSASNDIVTNIKKLLGLTACGNNGEAIIRDTITPLCYANIFSTTHPSTVFYSLGGCNDIEEDKLKVIGLTQAIVPNTNVIRIIDRDDRSENEVEELSEKGIKVLDRRHLESYLLDDEIIKKWCATVGKAELENSALTIKQQAINASISRGNATDDIKSASNDIVTNIKKLLGLTACGNNGEAIIRDTITPLITPDTQVYQQLERLIFG